MWDDEIISEYELVYSLRDSSPDLGIPHNELQRYLTQCFVKSELENSDHVSKIYQYINLFHCYQAIVICLSLCVGVVRVCARACTSSHSKAVF